MQADLAAHFAALDVTEAVSNDPEAAARAAEEERRADDIWRALKEQQRAREEAEEEEAFKALQAAKAERRKPPPPPQQPAAATASSSTTRDDDEPDATGWTPLEQRALEAAGALPGVAGGQHRFRSTACRRASDGPAAGLDDLPCDWQGAWKRHFIA